MIDLGTDWGLPAPRSRLTLRRRLVSIALVVDLILVGVLASVFRLAVDHGRVAFG
jgi:hypothetical protein